MIVDIKIEDLKIHPKNVRQEYNDIDELADSIKERGILQNLTVVPDPDDPGKYFVVIGNRRLTAAKKAGIETAPCTVIDDMSDKDQIVTMLTENMNRNDLKIYEESSAMQMCFSDLGLSIDEIAKETGLSKTTVGHRLNVAKLDKRALKKITNDPNFQLTLTDLQSLEKIDDVKTRNELLKKSRDSRDLANRARGAAREQEEKKHETSLILMCKHKGIKKAPKEAEREYYTDKWETLWEKSLDENPPKQLQVKGADGRELFYMSNYGRFRVIARGIKKKRELSPREIKEREQKQIEKQVKELYRKITDDMQDFIRNIIDGKIKPVKNTEKIDELLWKIMMREYAYVSERNVQELLLGKDIYAKGVTDEDRAEAKEKANALPVIYQ